MRTIDLILYVIAGLCFALSVFPPASVRANLVALGLLAWVLVPLIHAAQGTG